MTRKCLPAECTASPDTDTGRTVIQWTNTRCTNQHLYFTSFSVTADDRWLVFISDRDGHPNLHAIDRQDGSIQQLSYNNEGLLLSYVYPQGGSRGLGKASPSLDPVRNTLFYIRNHRVFSVDLDGAGEERDICGIPGNWCSAYTHVSPDGQLLCIPCADPRAFVDHAENQWDQLRLVPERMKNEGLVSRICLLNITSGDLRVAAEVPFWVTHVQFDPAGSGRIVFNREGFVKGTGRPFPNRIWCMEPDGSVRPLSTEPEGEWRAHENWARDGGGIIYHGARDNGEAFVAERAWDGHLIRESSLHGVRFHHATGTFDSRTLLADLPDGTVSLLNIDAPEPAITGLCRHDTSIENQDAHAHPIITPNGRSVIFTSNRTGNCNVYEVFLPATESGGKTIAGQSSASAPSTQQGKSGD